MNRLTAALILAPFFSITILAQASHVNKIQKQQKYSIHQGIKSGELTKAEAKSLIRKQKHIQKDIKLAKADGKFNRIEKKHIYKEQMLASNKILKTMSNSRKRF